MEGDLLLDQLALPLDNTNRLHGVLLKGATPGENLGVAFDGCGDVNGDGYADVIVGDPNAQGGKGEAVILFGSRYIESPGGGWTIDYVVNNGLGISFVGEDTSSLAGDQPSPASAMWTATAYDDFLIAAPGAAGGRGKVYLIYGGPQLSGSYRLADVGTVSLPGAIFTGRAAGDQLGGRAS